MTTSRGSGNLYDPANWGANVDGTGSHPADFAGDNQLYFLLNTSSVSLSTIWGIYGNNSKLIIGDGTNLTVAAGGFLSATVDVASGVTLTLTHGEWPTFGSIAGSVNFDNSAGIKLPENKILPASSGYFTLVNGDLNLNGFSLTVKGRFRCNTNKVAGSGTFVLDSAATIGICSPNGISATGATGDIQSTGRVFSRYSNYNYLGTANQVTGNGVPDTVSNLTVFMANRTLTTSLSKPIVVTGNLTMNSGKFKLGTYNGGRDDGIQARADRFWQWGKIVPSQGHMSEDGKKIVIDNGRFARVTLTRP